MRKSTSFYILACSPSNTKDFELPAERSQLCTDAHGAWGASLQSARIETNTLLDVCPRSPSS